MACHSGFTPVTSDCPSCAFWNSLYRNWYLDLTMYSPLGLWGHVSISGWFVRHRGIALMVFTSKLSNIFSITSVFHGFCTGSISELTLVPNNASGRGDNTLGECFRGSQLSSQISTDYPSPILHTAPLLMTSLPLSILRQAYEAELGLAASMMELFGKNLALNTL